VPHWSFTIGQSSTAGKLSAVAKNATLNCVRKEWSVLTCCRLWWYADCERGTLCFHEIDYDSKVVSLIHRGNILKNYPFASFVSVDGQVSSAVFTKPCLRRKL